MLIGLLKPVLELASLLDQFLDFVSATVLGQFVSCVSGEHPGVSESSLDQGRKRSDSCGGVDSIAARDLEQLLAHNLRDGNSTAFGGYLDLLPLGIGRRRCDYSPKRQRGRVRGKINECWAWGRRASCGARMLRKRQEGRERVCVSVAPS